MLQTETYREAWEPSHREQLLANTNQEQIAKALREEARHDRPRVLSGSIRVASDTGRLARGGDDGRVDWRGTHRASGVVPEALHVR